MKTKPVASRFDPAGRCNQCCGGWLCKDCSAEGLERDKKLSAVLRQTAAGIRANRIAEVCARFEIESNEFETREEIAARMIAQGAV